MNQKLQYLIKRQKRNSFESRKFSFQISGPPISLFIICQIQMNQDLGLSGQYLKGVLDSVVMKTQNKSQIKEPSAKRNQVKRTERRKQYIDGLKSWIGDKAKNADKQKQIPQDEDKLKEEEKERPASLKKVQQKSKSQVQKIIQVLRFVYDEFSKEGNELTKPLGLFYKWQIEQIAENTKDTNLGDFILKLPNPDNLPDQYLSLYPKIKQDGNEEIEFEDVKEMYDNLFALQEKTNIYQSKIQKTAFNIGFYLLDLKERFEPNELVDEFERAQSFFKNYRYYKKVINLELIQYLKIKQSPEIIDEEAQLSNKFKGIIGEIVEKCSIFTQEDFEKVNAQYFTLKQRFFKTLQKEIQQIVRIQSSYPTALLLKSQSLTDFLETFPDFTKKIIDTVQSISEDTKRKFCKGEYLVKTTYKDQLVWYIENRRPYDILTLLRKFILYRITQKGKLFVRSFLSKNQKEFFIVVKSSEGIMEEYSQNNQISMEVELGSTDLFSFEPVDGFLRPLRVNPYIRDRSFRNKYNLDVDKNDKDEGLGEQSIEAQSFNLYRKAESMNKEELRAKIILDQEQVDSCYEWLSQKLGISYIKSDQVIFNAYNDQVIDDDVWEIYYVFNKFIIEYVKRVKQLYALSDPKSLFIETITGNLGLLLRLMLLKALYSCNDLFYNHRTTKGIVPRFCSNLFRGSKVFKNIWDYLDVQIPKGFWPYIKIDKLERIWKKYQVNQKKNRSKFFPAQRLTITNRIIRNSININKALTQRFVIDYYPVHDPFILKNIKIQPYLKVIKNKLFEERGADAEVNDGGANSLFDQYASEYSKLDFTNESIQDKLSARFGKVTQFSIDTVRYYCGTKLALYFEYMRFLSLETVPYLFLAFIFQIVFWIETSQILAEGASPLSQAGNIITVITTLLNIIWTTKTVQNWRTTEKKLAQAFGMSNKRVGDDEKNKRVQFVGTFKRNFLNDQINYEYVPVWSSMFTSLFTFLVNLAFVGFMGLTIFQIFILKTYMYQLGIEQTYVNLVPSILISLAIKVFNFLYTKLIYSILQFQNHKTITEYETSLVSKSYVITFIVTFYSILIYGYFAQYIDGDFLCIINTTSGNTIINCPYFMINQLQSYVIVDFILTIVAAITPYATFQIMQLLSPNPQTSAQLNVNHLESIDEYFEEQDKMSSYMYDDELDRSWLGYIKYISIFTSLALFGNALPLIYVMLYLTGIVGMHAGKYEIIYLSKRTIPMNTGNTQLWLNIMDIISVVGILSNLAYLVYVRDVFTERKSTIFFFLFIALVLFKYALYLFSESEDDKMTSRNRIKTFNIINDKGLDFSQNKSAALDTDISNVVYNESELQRKFPKFTGANVKIKAKKQY